MISIEGKNIALSWEDTINAFAKAGPISAIKHVLDKNAIRDNTL